MEAWPPMRYDSDAPTERVLSKRNVWICWWNVAAVVLSLLTVCFFTLVEPPPPLPPPDPTTCPFDVVACNRQCALKHVDCKEYNRNLPKKKGKKKGMRNCDMLHGGERYRSTAAFDSVEEKTAYLESLDWEHEPTLWGLRKENIGDGRCDRSGCGQELCECHFDGGDCVEEPDFRYIILIPLMIISICIYLVSMYIVLVMVIGYRLKAPRLREGELTAYVEKMQRAQPQVSFSVVCSHTENGKSKKTVVKHCSSHPFTYATCTDKSKLAKSWQQPTGGGDGEDGSLGTGFVAVVSSELSWSAAKGVTADKLKAEKERLHRENKHRDSKCSVTIKVSLPGQLSTQLYAPADAKFTKRLSPVAELLLVFFGLGAPLYFFYVRRLSRHIAHTVHKTIYIEDHAAPAGG